MTRISDKFIRNYTPVSGKSVLPDFDRSEFDFTLRDKGYSVIYEKAYRCPCSTSGNDHLDTCKNCGGTGWFWANPVQTRMVLTSINSEKRYEEYGRDDVGMVNVTSYEFDKLSRMDRIVVNDATTEHNEVIFPVTLQDGSGMFCYTKYNIKYIESIMMFDGAENKLIKWSEFDDYSFRSNVLTIPNVFEGDVSLSIRYGHSPTYYIWDIGRDSMVTRLSEGGADTPIQMPINAVAKRAHLVKDSENFSGDRLFDNSWIKDNCIVGKIEGITDFERSIKYRGVQDIFDALTDDQKNEISNLLKENDFPFTLPFKLT